MEKVCSAVKGISSIFDYESVKIKRRNKEAKKLAARAKIKSNWKKDNLWRSW